VALLEDPAEARRLAVAGRQTVEETFSWKRIGDRLLDAYEGTLARA
jgi:glycosyltransferase involved in cell wall biosynthesis